MVVRGSGKNERAETCLGMGEDVVMETAPGWTGWSCAKEEGEAHLGSSRGAPLSSSGLGPDSLAAPAAGASSGSGSAAIYGAWMGGGRQLQLPRHRPVGREKRGGAGLLPAREPQSQERRVGWGWLRGRTPTDTVTHIFPSCHTHTHHRRDAHIAVVCATHTFTPENDGDAHPRLTGSHVSCLTHTGASS